MAEKSSDCTIPQLFINSANVSAMASVPSSSCNLVESNSMSSILPAASGISSHVNGTCTMYAASIPAELADNLPEGTVFQIMPDATILTTVPATDSVCEAIVFQNPVLKTTVANTIASDIGSTISSTTSYAAEVTQPSSVNQSLSSSIRLSEANISDIDLSFLTEPDEPTGTNDDIISQEHPSQKPLQQETLNQVLNQEVQNYSDLTTASTNNQELNNQSSENCETIVVDVSNPIQLSQNSLIVVNGKKCILQHDPETGQVVAYPVKEPEKLKRKRGRPRKVCTGSPTKKDASEPEKTNSVIAPPFPSEPPSFPSQLLEDESIKEKGLSQVVTDDGALVRRSMRKRKRAKILSDYETGNLVQELGSDAEDNRNLAVDDGIKRSKKPRGPGRPRNNSLKEGKNSKGRPKKYDVGEEPSQAFLIQTADGQSMMIQVPLSSIPAGMSLQDVAQGIANNFNLNIPLNANAVKENVTTEGVDPGLTQSTNLANPAVNVLDFLNKEAMGIQLNSCSNLSTTSLANAEKSPRLIDPAPGELVQGLEVVTSVPSSVGNLSQMNISQSNHLLVSEAQLSQILPTPSVSDTVVSAPQTVNTSGATLTDTLSASSADVMMNYGTRRPSITEKFPESFMEVSGFSALAALSGPGFDVEKVAKCSIPPLTTGVPDRSSSAEDLLCKGFTLSDNFCFQLPDAAQVKESSKIMHGHPTNVNLSESVLPGIAESPQDNGSSKDQDKSEERCKLSSAMIDHEYTSKEMFSRKTSEGEKADRCHTSLPITNGESNVNSCSDSSVGLVSTVRNHSTGINNIVSGCSAGNSSVQPEIEDRKDILQMPAVDFSSCIDKSPGKCAPDLGEKDVCFDIQRSLAPTSNASASWTGVTSILSTCDTSASMPPTSVASTSKTLATVIPLPKNNSPLLLPKTEVSDSSPPSAAVEEYCCFKCKHMCGSASEYEEHLLTHGEKLHCKCCDYICFKQEDMIKHFKSKHPRCICTKCNYMADQPCVIKRHMFRHTEKGSPCEICGKVYRDHYILKMHVKMVHMPSSVFYKCDVCSKQFNRKAHLKRHKRTHDPDKPYKCPSCSYRGSEKSDVTKHMLVHEEPKHTCDICGRVFRHIKNRDLHLKRHTGQRDFKCGACEFFGYTFTDIRRHIERKHKPNQDPSLLCDACGISFKTPEQLKAHQISKQCELIISRHNASTSGNTSDLVHFDNGDVEVVGFSVETSKEEEIVEVSFESPEQKPVVLSEIAGLSTNEVVLSNIGQIINSSGPIIISGLGSAESLAAANLTLISSTNEKSNEVIIDSGQENESLLKMFDDGGPQQ